MVSHSGSLNQRTLITFVTTRVRSDAEVQLTPTSYKAQRFEAWTINWKHQWKKLFERVR